MHKEKGQRWLGKEVIHLLSNKKSAVIDGLRFPEDHALMVESYGPAFQHFHISSSETKRSKRIKNRKTDNIPLESAKNHPVEQEIIQLKKIANHIIHNNGTKEKLYSKLEKILTNQG